MKGALLAAAMLVAAACGGAGGGASTAPSGGAKAPDSLVVAYQPGIGYAPLLIMKQQRWIEADYPNMKVEYRLLSNGDAIRDGIIAGQMKIASPAIDSVQAIALRKLAEKDLGDAHKLDSNLVAMSHPDGLQNLQTGAIAAHFTSPPYQFQEADRGAHTIGKSYDAFGPSTFNSVFTSKKFYDQYPQFTEKFYGYLQRADDLIKKDPKQAATLVAAADGKPEMADQYRDWMTRPNVEYNTVPAGFTKYAEFM